MKTLKHILLTATFLAATAGMSSAGNGLDSFSGNDHIKKQIQKEISFPDFLKTKKEGAEVKVSFTLDKDGKATLVSVNTGDPNLKKYVEEKMKDMQFASPDNENEVHNINLVFKRI